MQDPRKALAKATRLLRDVQAARTLPPSRAITRKILHPLQAAVT